MIMSQDQVCQDHHVCRNGSVCVDHPDFPGSYTCDCSTTAASGTVYAGLSCDHQATVFCNPENDANADSFCTNNGECVKNVDDLGTHYGCKCPQGYTGDVRTLQCEINPKSIANAGWIHCQAQVLQCMALPQSQHGRGLTLSIRSSFCYCTTQFCELVDGQSVPKYHQAASQAGGVRGGSGGGNTTLVASLTAAAAALCLAFVIAIYVVKKRRNGEKHETMSPKAIRQADSAQLDADGQVLRNSMHGTGDAGLPSPATSNTSGRTRQTMSMDVADSVPEIDDDDDEEGV